MKMTLKMAGAAALGFALLGLTGCGEGVLPESEEVVYFSPLATSIPDARPLPDGRPELSDEDRAAYMPIVESFRASGDELLRRPDVEARLQSIETVFALTGNYFELVALFQKEVEAHGVDSPVAPRLAWAYLQLGQQRLGRDLIDAIQKARPDDALSWLLEGAYWLDEAETSADAARKTIAAWTTVLEKDPNFPDFQGFNAETLRQRINALQARLPAEDAEPAEDTAVAAAPEAPQPAEPAPAEAEAAAPEPEPVVAEEAPPAEETSAEEAPAPAPEPAPVAQAEPSAPILAACGQIALSSGDAKAARRHFAEALKADPDHLDAAVGHLHASARLGADAPALTEAAQKLAERDDLPARTAYELGLFGLRTLKEPDLARRFFDRVRRADPAFAERVRLDALMP